MDWRGDRAGPPAPCRSLSSAVSSDPNSGARIKYAIASQRDRRNITDADIARCVMVVDRRKSHGAELGGRGNQYTGGKASGDALPKSASHTAHIAGTSTTKVEKVRRVVDHAKTDPKPLAEVLSGRGFLFLA